MPSRRHLLMLDCIAALVVVGASVYVQWGTGIPDPDTFYHARVATMIRDTRAPVQSFPYLTETVLADAYVDHHFLYHVLLIPFVAFGDPLVGMRIATVLAIGIAAFLFLRLIRSWGSWWGPLLVPLLFVTRNLWFRLNLQKAPAVSLIFFALGIMALTSRRRRPLWVGIVAALYVLLYNGWPVLVLSALAILGGELLAARMSDPPLNGGKSPLSGGSNSAIATAGGLLAGVVLGLLIHPNFPTNLGFSWLHIVQIGAINAKNLFGLGAEWYPYAPLELLKDSSVAGAFVVAALALFFSSLRLKAEPRLDEQAIGRALGLTLLFAIFLPLAVKSRRHIEYALPAIILWIGYFLGMMQPFAKSVVVPWVKRSVSSIPWMFKWAPAILFCISILLVSVYQVVTARGQFANGWRKDHLLGASRYLDAHTRPGAIVLNGSWADPPFLLYHSLHNRYVVALDPTFAYARSPERFLRWQEISQGRFSGDLGAAAASYGAEAVLITHGSDAAYLLFAKSKQFREVYKDNEAAIFIPVQNRFASL